MNTQIKLSRVQKAIQKEIETFIDNQDRMMERTREDKYSASKDLMYYFHNNKSIAVDGGLYDILNYGHGDFNYGTKLCDNIHAVVDKLGYYLEYEGQGIYNIEKV